ncbi:MAG TPA: metallophosphoesterase [Steroidobacteraceae bacterium]
MRTSLRVVLYLGVILSGPAGAATTFQIPDSALPVPLVVIAYGDTRFTAADETAASSPTARRALVAKIAAEDPAAIFISGDLTFHGIAADYEVYRAETQLWREKHLRVYPALGNHELSACPESSCLDLWWRAFPELRGQRWYSVAVGSKLVGIALDSDISLLPGSAQRIWLEGQVSALDSAVRAVLIVLHHPPAADVQTVKLVDHNPRPNEQALAAYLQTAAAHSAARFVVSAGHIHNYERLAQDGVTYLVSGGGGATPYEVDRNAADLYLHKDFPNYHYVRFELRGTIFSGEMIRLQDHAARRPSHWQIKDRFTISLQP